LVSWSNFILNFAWESTLDLQHLKAVTIINKQEQYLPFEESVRRPQRFHKKVLSPRGEKEVIAQGNGESLLR
jgi:hypothetical protein